MAAWMKGPGAGTAMKDVDESSPAFGQALDSHSVGRGKAGMSERHRAPDDSVARRDVFFQTFR